MSRRLLSILLFVLYLAPAFGAQAILHYCGQQLESISFLPVEEDACCGGETMPPGCCRDEVVKMQVSDDQQITAAEYPVFTFAPICLPPVAPVFVRGTLPAATSFRRPLCLAPLRSPRLPIYLTHRVFRI